MTSALAGFRPGWRGTQVDVDFPFLVPIPSRCQRCGKLEEVLSNPWNFFIPLLYTLQKVSFCEQGKRSFSKKCWSGWLHGGERSRSRPRSRESVCGAGWLSCVGPCVGAEPPAVSRTGPAGRFISARKFPSESLTPWGSLPFVARPSVAVKQTEVRGCVHRRLNF